MYKFISLVALKYILHVGIMSKNTQCNPWYIHNLQLEYKMENVLFVNISDIHVSDNNKDRVINKLNRFIGFLNVLSIDHDNIFILVSGDIAYSGKKEEYDYIYPHFEELATKYNLILCPGNHDHDFSCYDSIVRNQLLKADVNTLDDEALELIIKGMNHYIEFEDSLTLFEPREENKLSKSYLIKLEDRKLEITTYNTAWCSQLHEKGGSMSFPTKCIIEPSQCEINITMFHHPLSWLEPNNNRHLRNILRENSNIVITGHEHVDDSFKVESESNKCLMLEAMPFDDDWSEDNGFLTFKFESNDIIIRPFKWQDNEFVKINEIRQSEIIKSNSISIHNYTVKMDYLKSIRDIGVNFIHPDKDDLTLEDIFVYPNLRKIDSDNKLDMKNFSSGNILSGDKRKVILVGDEYCGKSTLLKKYFLDAAKKGYLPVSIDCSMVKRAGIEYDKTLQKSLILQYENLSLTDFVNSEITKVALIDSFDLIRGDKKSIEVFLDKTSRVFDIVIISVSDSFDFNGSELIGENYFDETFEKYEMLRLGYKLRYDLVHKWNSLKEECCNESKLLLAKNDLTFKTISRVIGRNYIPSTPFFLLTLLQSMDSGNSLDVNASSYGYYYEYLITHSLGSASVRKEELDEFFNYVKELSFHYFTKNIKEETKDNLWDFNTKFCQEYGVRIDYETRISLLVKAKIMECKNDGYYKFKYPYVYYFFIAKHLAETIRDEDTVEIIDNLIGTLGKRRSMSILMFLTHHSRDESILDKVVEQAKKLFKDNKPAHLNLNIQSINDIIDSLPTLSFEKKDRFQLRREYENSRDEIEGNHEFHSIDDEEDDNGDSLHDSNSEDQVTTDLLKEMNLTFKSLEILGQLSRNYYGSLKVPQKKRLLGEAIDAPLRSLDFFISYIKDDADVVLDTIERKIAEQNSERNINYTQLQLREIAKHLLFQLVLGLSYTFITKISSSIGSNNLQPVIDELCDAHNSNAGKILKLATLLELGNSITVEHLRNILQSLDKNPISDNLVKSIILNYLYMFERSDAEVKQICAVAGINYNSVSRQIGFDKLTKKN